MSSFQGILTGALMGDYVTNSIRYNSIKLNLIRRDKTRQPTKNKGAIKMKKAIAEISIDSHAIYQRLIKAQPGELITYVELSNIIGRDFQSFGRCNYETASRIALRDNKMVFVAVRNQGIKRLENEAIPSVIGVNSISKIRRLSKRSAKKIMATNYDALSNESKIIHNTGLSVLGAFMQMTKPKSISVIEEGIKANDLNRMTFAKTLEQFKSTK